MPRLARIVTAAAGLAALAAPLAGQATPPAILYRVPEMDSVNVARDVVYKTAIVTGRPNTPLTLDVYHPRATGAAPALVFVHGGLVAGQTPTAKDWESYRSWGRLAAASGMAGVVINHRMNTNDDADQAGADLLDALTFIRSRAAEYGVDPNRICGAFFSAGGPISSLVLRERMPFIRCVVLYYPFLDLEHLRETTPFRPPRSAARIDSLRSWSPRAALTRGPDSLPPILLARAGRDQIPFLNASIARFMTDALANNVRIDFYNHPSGVHGFDSSTDDPRTREIIAETIRFARRHLGLENSP